MTKVCPDCAFDASEWNEQDTTRTLAHRVEYVDLWTADTPAHLRAEIDRVTSATSAAVADAAEPLDAVHALWHGLVAIADHRLEAGDGIAPQHGVIEQINVSAGGVPKSSVGSAGVVGRRGLTDDVQRTRLHHGRPWQALCLWSADVIDELQADGHSVVAGAAGENITVRGVDWSALRAGLYIRLGPVHAQLSSPATPCQNIASNFRDRNIGLVDHDIHPARTRWYATVLAGGPIEIGDAVTLNRWCDTQPTEPMTGWAKRMRWSKPAS